MKSIVISPPFGSYSRFISAGATPILGSFTLTPRSGRTLKVAQFVWDNVHYPVPHGWRNRIGLRNSGIRSIQAFSENVIYSVTAINSYEWQLILEHLIHLTNRNLQIEINLGCRNVNECIISNETLHEFCNTFTVIVKLPTGEDALRIAAQAVTAGARCLDVANTFHDEHSSISGRPLKALNLPLVEWLARCYPTISIIGNGGIYSYQDLLDYKNAGATHFSLCTVCFRPWVARSIIESFYRSEG